MCLYVLGKQARAERQSAESLGSPHSTEGRQQQRAARTTPHGEPVRVVQVCRALPFGYCDSRAHAVADILELWTAKVVLRVTPAYRPLCHPAESPRCSILQHVPSLLCQRSPNDIWC